MKEARVIQEHKTNYVILDAGREYIATVRGSFFDDGLFPKVGDFVLYSEVSDDRAVIEKIMPRTSSISRKAVGTVGEQVIVANVDVIFIVMGLDDDFNPSRLERYLLLATQSKVKPVVVLNKRDSVENLDSYLLEISEMTEGVPVEAVSAKTGENMTSLEEYLSLDTTAVLLGSSGAGKSTITNWFYRADKQQVQKVRTGDSHGRHTTTFRELFNLPNGGYLIDTPGMRELGVESTVEEEALVFEKFDTLAQGCRFVNCDHEKSAGCAIIKALEVGEISERQLNNYLKLRRERLFAESKQDEGLSRERKQKKKVLRKTQKAIKKNRAGEDIG